jgi:hypothetical protein
VSVTCPSGNYDQAIAFFSSSIQVAPDTVSPSGVTFIIPQVEQHDARFVCRAVADDAQDRNNALPAFFANLAKQQVMRARNR